MNPRDKCLETFCIETYSTFTVEEKMIQNYVLLEYLEGGQLTTPLSMSHVMFTLLTAMGTLMF